MVKRSRGQSAEAPRWRSCFMIDPPDWAFHSQTFSWNLSRPKSRREMPSLASSRSTTIWVAMPAWSMPGCHSTSRPRMRR